MSIIYLEAEKKIVTMLESIDEYIVFDLETTGFSYIKGAEIIEIGAVKISKGVVVDKFKEFIKPIKPIPTKITEITTITNDDVLGAKHFNDVLTSFKEFIGDTALVAHNANFDIGFLSFYCLKLNIQLDNVVFDTLIMARTMLTKIGYYDLMSIAYTLKINILTPHRALNDAEMTADIFMNLRNRYILQKAYFQNDRRINDKFRISHVSYWESGDYKRIYINGDLAEVYFDVVNKKWVSKQRKKFNELETEVFKILKISSLNELYDFKGKVYF